MQITIETTDETNEVVVNGVPIPYRVWKGKTSRGTPIEAAIFALLPWDLDGEALEAFRKEMEEAVMLRAQDIGGISIGRKRRRNL